LLIALHPDKNGNDPKKAEQLSTITVMRADLLEEVQHGLQYISDRALYRNREFVGFERAGGEGAAGGSAAGGAAAGSSAANDWFADYYRQRFYETYFNECMAEAEDSELLREAKAAAEKAAAEKNFGVRFEKDAAEAAKISNDFWEDAVAWEAQRVEALNERKLRAQTAKRWAFAAEQEEEQQAIADEAARRAAIHENATKAALCLRAGFKKARIAQEEAEDKAREMDHEKDEYWAWWLSEIRKAGFDVFDFCDASFAPLTEEAMELKFCSDEDCPRQRSHSPIVISSDDEADDKDMAQDQEPEDTTAPDMPQDQEAQDTTVSDMPEGREEENTTAGMDMRAPAEKTSAEMDMCDPDEEDSSVVSSRGRKRTRTNFYKPPPRK
jgi:hypothetical protein